MLAAACEGPHGKTPPAQTDLSLHITVQSARKGAHSTCFSLHNLTFACVYFAS